MNRYTAQLYFKEIKNGTNFKNYPAVASKTQSLSDRGVILTDHTLSYRKGVAFPYF